MTCEARAARSVIRKVISNVHNMLTGYLDPKTLHLVTINKFQADLELIYINYICIHRMSVTLLQALIKCVLKTSVLFVPFCKIKLNEFRGILTVQHVCYVKIPAECRIASFLAEISVSSPRIIFIFIIYKNIFWIKASKKYLI